MEENQKNVIRWKSGKRISRGQMVLRGDKAETERYPLDLVTQKSC